MDRPGHYQFLRRRRTDVAGVDSLNALFLTPLPGTRLWDQMKSEDRIALNAYPEDWRYYTLTFPVARYRCLSSKAVIQEMIDCSRIFYSLPAVLGRVWSSIWQRRKPFINLVANLATRNNSRVECRAYADFQKQFPTTSPLPPPALVCGVLGRDIVGERGRAEGQASSG